MSIYLGDKALSKAHLVLKDGTLKTVAQVYAVVDGVIKRLWSNNLMLFDNGKVGITPSYHTKVTSSVASLDYAAGSTTTLVDINDSIDISITSDASVPSGGNKSIYYAIDVTKYKKVKMTCQFNNVHWSNNNIWHSVYLLVSTNSMQGSNSVTNTINFTTDTTYTKGRIYKTYAQIGTNEVTLELDVSDLSGLHYINIVHVHYNSKGAGKTEAGILSIKRIWLE